MKSDLDRRLAGWFATAGAEDVPAGLLDEVFGVTRATPQRRGALARLASAAAEWWRAPMVIRVAPRQLAYLVLVGLLVAAAAIALAAVGARRPAPPFGLAANGVVAFDRAGAIVIARFDGRQISEVGTVPDARGPVFSPDGSRVAFYRRIDGMDTIIIASPDGRDPVAVSAGVVLDDLAKESPPSWSPDSRSVTFDGLVGNRRMVFVAGVDGGAPVAVGDAGLTRLDPAWSPDGAWIAFHGFLPEEDAAAGVYRTKAGLYVIRPDGEGQRLLVGGTGGDFIYRRPQWLPDPGRRVLAYAIGLPSAYDIAMFDMDRMTETVISREGAAELWPAWSPDGSELAWAASDLRIRVAHPGSTSVRILPPDVDYQLVWSPDQRYLLGFTDEARTGLAVMSSDGSTATITVPIVGASRSHWSWQRRAP